MDKFLTGMTKEEHDALVALIRIGIATYLLGQMMDTGVNTRNGEDAKTIKVRAAFDYADLLMKG